MMKKIIWTVGLICLSLVMGAQAQDYKEMSIDEMESMLFDKCDTTLCFITKAELRATLKRYGVKQIVVEYYHTPDFIKVELGLKQCKVGIDPIGKKLNLTKHKKRIDTCLAELASEICDITFVRSKAGEITLSDSRWVNYRVRVVLQSGQLVTWSIRDVYPHEVKDVEKMKYHISSTGVALWNYCSYCSQMQ